MPTPSPRLVSLKELLAQHTQPADPALVRAAPKNAVRCLACGHRCLVFPGRAGVCRVRFNQNGVLRVPHGYVAGLAVDPIEKKPFFHVLPGSDALSFGMLGCNLHCPYCQNWVSSQTLKDTRALAEPTFIDPDRIVELAITHNCPILTSTYNEPFITAEWAVDIFRRGKPRGLRGSFVSNGHATPEALEYLRPWVDFLKIDLKSFRDPTYRQLGGVLENVLDTIRHAHRMGFWVEIVTLVVPTLNDTDAELTEIASFIASVSPDIPWHVTAFHPDYRLTSPPRTSVDTLLHACELGRRAGLKFVYAGNLPGLVDPYENTLCPRCGSTLVERHGFLVRANRIVDGRCPDCQTPIPGVWS